MSLILKIAAVQKRCTFFKNPEHSWSFVISESKQSSAWLLPGWDTA